MAGEAGPPWPIITRLKMQWKSDEHGVREERNKSSSEFTKVISKIMTSQTARVFTFYIFII